MSTFHLKVLTVDRVFFDGEVDRIVVRTTQGDVGILPNHVKYLAALGIGGLTILTEGMSRVAAIAGGFIDVSKEGTVILARTCEWADEIDINRARELKSAQKRCSISRPATASRILQTSNSKKRSTVSVLHKNKHKTRHAAVCLVFSSSGGATRAQVGIHPAAFCNLKSRFVQLGTKRLFILQHMA